MQTSVPGIIDFSTEPKHVLDAYGPDVRRPGSYAFNCLLARRLSEQGVRFVQCFHMGWDHHGGLPAAIKGQVKDTDQATAALLDDLQQRGLRFFLEHTDPESGLTRDRAPASGAPTQAPASIAAAGFALTAW
jgi:hypothetical protein